MSASDENLETQFPSTRWSLVKRAGAEAAGGPALGELLQRYLPALRAHLVHHKRVDPGHVDDLLQSFVTAKFLEQQLAARADQSRGKFRTFVLTALDRFLVSERRREGARKRNPPAPHVDPADAGLVDSDVPPLSSVFDIAWAREVLAAALSRMQQHCHESGRPDLWEVFESRLVRPTLEDSAAPAYGDLVQQCGFASPTQAANALMTAKRMFERSLRAVIGEYAKSKAEIDEEIRELREILGRG